LGSGHRNVMPSRDDFGIAMDVSVTSDHEVDRTDRFGINVSLA
jgi:hypothetical protein